MLFSIFKVCSAMKENLPVKNKVKQKATSSKFFVKKSIKIRAILYQTPTQGRKTITYQHGGSKRRVNSVIKLQNSKV